MPAPMISPCPEGTRPGTICSRLNQTPRILDDVEIVALAQAGDPIIFHAGARPQHAAIGHARYGIVLRGVVRIAFRRLRPARRRTHAPSRIMVLHVADASRGHLLHHLRSAHAGHQFFAATDDFGHLVSTGRLPEPMRHSNGWPPTAKWKRSKLAISSCVVRLIAFSGPSLIAGSQACL